MERIEKELSDKEYFTALLLSFIYSSIRLRSLVADYLGPSRAKWKETHTVLSFPSFKRLLDYSKKQGIIGLEQYKGLDNLRIERNHIAHESTKWRHLKKQDMAKMEDACEFAVVFLKQTSS